MYLYTLIIGHKSYNVLSIQNKLILPNEIANCCDKWCVFDKKVKTQQQKIKHKNACGSRGLNPGPLAPKADCVTTAPPSQLRVSIVVKPFNCFDAMDRNVNKQSQICGPDISIKYIFSVLFLHAWITIFGSFSYLQESVSLLKCG